jgi:hypothetical protein
VNLDRIAILNLRTEHRLEALEPVNRRRQQSAAELGRTRAAESLRSVAKPPRPSLKKLSERQSRLGRKCSERRHRKIELGRIRVRSVASRAIQRRAKASAEKSTWGRAGTSDTAEGRICRTNVLASNRACTRLPPQDLHGKEGTDGSSPPEGFGKGQQMAFFVASPRYARSLRCPQPVPNSAGAPTVDLDRSFSLNRTPP